MFVPLVSRALVFRGGRLRASVQGKARPSAMPRVPVLARVLILLWALVLALAAEPIMALAAPEHSPPAELVATNAVPAGQGSSAAAEDGSRTAYVLVDAQSWLNVRERPEAHAAVTLRLTRGDAVTVCRIDATGWAEVSRAGDPGYCRARYLCDAPPADAEACVAAAGKLNVRAAPGGRVVGRLARGEAVTVLGTLTDDGGDRWAILPGGFVLARYLEAAP